MRRKKWVLILVSTIGILASGCMVLTPKRDVMKTSVAKTSTRKTSKPRVFSSAGQIVAVGQEEEVISEVEYSKSIPIVKTRSFWSRWYVWVGLIILITYFGLWPLLIRVVRKLRERTHALVTLVKQVDVYKETTDEKSQKELKTILKTQDPITKKQVDKIRNGN